MGPLLPIIDQGNLQMLDTMPSSGAGTDQSRKAAVGAIAMRDAL